MKLKILILSVHLHIMNLPLPNFGASFKHVRGVEDTILSVLVV